MLGIYRMGLIRPTEKFVIVVSSIAGAIMIVYVMNFLLSFAGGILLHSSGPIGIGISIFS